MADYTNISLEGGEVYVTHNKSDCFRVIEGNVLIYIVPYINKKIGRRSFLYEASKKEMIPAFSYKDFEYQEWRFCFVAKEKCKLNIIENGTTSILKQKFAKKAKILDYEYEGFENGLVNLYKKNTVTEDGFIIKTQHANQETYENSFKLIYNVFNDDFKIKEARSTNLLYEASKLVCQTAKISIASLEKIKESCGKKITIQDIARISHFAYREIVLEENWFKKDSGIIITFDETDKPFVCIPKGTSSYLCHDIETGKKKKLDAKIAESFKIKGIMFYRPLPARKLTLKDIFKYCLLSIKKVDVIYLVALTIISTLVGILLPIMNQKIYDEFIPVGQNSLVIQLSCVIASFMLANVFFSVVKRLSNFRLVSRMSYDMQNAIYDRTFNLPESFFRDYESADLASRVMGASSLVEMVANFVFSVITIGIMLIIYFVKMIDYSTTLTFISLAMILLYSLIVYYLSTRNIKYKGEVAKLQGESSSKMYQFINGIAKIRIAGVENRALYEYLKPYAASRKIENKINIYDSLGNMLDVSIETLIMIVLYTIMIKGKMEISIGGFIAFNTAFGAFSGAMIQFLNGLIQVNELKPTYQRLKPILDTSPELDEAKELPGELTGTIEMNNVDFSYSNDGPNVLNKVSLEIKSGEYVGLVGPSGCGKSTLLKLLLGFEKPQAGKIYYDGKDIDSLDKRELRKKFGVVLQDGSLISGSIFENITITAPQATVSDVQKVIKAVGLEKDIKEMPMGLHTVLSEDCGTISGGQRQRILIARAIINNPKILFFDEATSALDNVTQAMVCETLDQMDSTRIVIAHRLSTIINCDRIIVMDKGNVIEQGTYEELMNNKGLFYTLASRQIS